MTVINATVGAHTPETARVVATIDGAEARLAVYDNEDLVGPQMYAETTPDADGVIRLTASGLEPDRRWWWAVEVDEQVDEDVTGTFRTLPPAGEPADVTFAAASCGGGNPAVPGVGDVLAASRLSNHPVYDSIRSRARSLNWSFFAHLGDLTYYDLGSNGHGITGGGSLANYRRMIDDVLLQPRQHALYRGLPWVYLPDDHDRGPNDHDRTYTNGANFDQVYRQKIPHHPLPAATGTWHAFQVARTLYIAADVRSARDPNDTPDGPDKTMLGAAQKAWMDQLLASTSAAFVVWLMPDDWIAPRNDSWHRYQHEQSEMVQMFGDRGFLDRICIVSGDIHMLAMDTGANSAGGIPVFQFASLDATEAGNVNLYDLGGRRNRGQYGTVRVDDDGTRIRVTASGWFV